MNAYARPEPAPQPVARRFGEGLAWIWPALVLCALVFVLANLFGGGAGSLHQTVLTALVNLIFVVGLYMFVGNSGVLSFGHASFMAIGAYTSALLTIPVALKGSLLPSLPHFLAVAHLPSLTAALIGGFVALLFALVVATPLMRLNGLAAGIATLSLLIIVHVVTGNWTAVTRGTETMVGVPIDLTLDQAILCSCGAILLAFFLQESRLGFRLRATREDEPAARAVGVGVFRERTTAFALSAFVVGVAGGLYAHYLGSFGADAFYLEVTFLTIVMLVVGGINSLAGAVVGSMVVSFVAEVLTRLERGSDVGPLHVTLPDGSQQIVLALFLLLVLILRPKGLMGGREIRWPFGRGR